MPARHSPPARPAPDSGTRAPVGALPALLFASGAVALVYEVAWQRQLADAFGSATAATAAVLAAYFAGLGLGAVLGGAFAERVRRPLRAYACLEAAVGAGALLVTPLLALAERLVAAGGAAESGSALLAGRVLAAFGVLALPTLGMGATLPLLVRVLPPGREAGPMLTRLYFLNTAGAAFGALALPFVLLPWLGLQGSVNAGAAINLLLAGAAWRLDARVGRPAESSLPPAPANRHPSRPAAFSGSATLAIAFLSGAFTFALQVLWNRAFAQVHENSMQAFAVIVGLVILALAGGAQLARTLLARGVSPRRLIGLTWGFAGVLALAAPSLFLAWTDGLRYLAEGGSALSRTAQLAGLLAGTMLPGMVLLGVSFPTLLDTCGNDAGGSRSRELSRLLLANVAGAITGALLAGLVLPAWLGMWRAFAVVAAALLFGAFSFWLPTRTSIAVRGITAILLLSAIAQAWIRERPLVRLAADAGERLVFVAEGAHGITAVTERAGSRRLKLNNHYALGGTAAVGDERMQAHVPLLLHPAPRQVAFLGLGTAISAGGARFHPVEKLTLVELVPEVVNAARDHFADANENVLHAPTSTVVLEDARHFLRHTPARFDVIVGDLVVPWRPGEGALFTHEHFAAAREALAPGGLYCQWFPLFQLSEEQFQILARTFLEVFPRAWVFRGDFSPQQPALALIASREGGFTPDAAIVRRRVAELRRDPANAQLAQSAVFWLSCVGALERSELAAREVRLNSENRPWVELLGAALTEKDPRHGPFVGRALQTWLESVHARSTAQLPTLSPEESAVLRAGPLLGEMTLQLHLENAGAVRDARRRLQRTLPANVYRTLFEAP